MSVFLVSDRCLAGWTAVGKTDGRLPGPMDGSALLWESANHRNIIWAKPLIWVKFTLLPHFHWAGLVLRQLAIVMGTERLVKQYLSLPVVWSTAGKDVKISIGWQLHST